MEIESKEARKKLTVVWFVFSGILLFIFVLQQLNGKFEDNIQEAWAWVSPTIFPFLSLVSCGYLLGKKEIGRMVVDKFYYRLCMGCSLFYFALLFTIIVFYPFSGRPVLEYYKSTNVFLVLVQSIISGVIGIFFIKGNGTR
jgi:hypothetical protein